MSELTRIIGLLYRTDKEDEKKLAADLLEQRKRVWNTALKAEARAYGCNKVPNAPNGPELRELKAMSARDAKSITNTWNRDVQRQIEKLYTANPRGNRFYYASRMEQWAAAREAWKLPQISVTTETQTTEFARERFRQFNLNDTQRFVFSGPAPTCQDCVTRFAAGVVNRQYIERYPTPRHPGCPHTWSVVKRPKLNCETLWLG